MLLVLFAGLLTIICLR